MRDGIAVVVYYIAVVDPLVNTHLLADEVGRRCRPVSHQIEPLAEKVDRYGRLVAMGHSGDHIFRAEGGIAAKKHERQAGLKSHAVEHWQVPLAKGDAQIALNPREGIVLTHSNDDIIGFHKYIGLTRRDELPTPPLVYDGADFFKNNAPKAAIFDHKFLRRHIVVDGNVFALRILYFPGRRLHGVERAAHDHAHLLAAQAAGSAAAVHGGVASSQHDHFSADTVDVLKSYVGQKLYAYVDVFGGLLPAR